MPRKRPTMSGAKILAVVVLLMIYVSIVAAYTLLVRNEDIYPFDVDRAEFMWTAIFPVYTLIWIFLILSVVRVVSVGTFAKVGAIGIIAISIEKTVWAMYMWDEYMYAWIPLLLGLSALFMFSIYLATKNVKLR